MRKKLLCLIIPAIFYGDNLKELVEYAKINNNLVISKNLIEKSKQKELESSKSLNTPTIDIGAFYQSLDKRTANLAGDIYSGYGQISYDIYDGGRKNNIVKQKQNELQSSLFQTDALKKSLSLQIVQYFFNIKNIEASIVALQEQKKSLKVQLDRVKKFYSANLATKDSIDKLQSAYDTNIYNIKSLKFEKLSLLRELELRVGKHIDILTNSSFIKKSNLILDLDDNIKALQAQESSLNFKVKSLNSGYMPHINISNKYSINSYDRTDALHPKGVDNQNQFMLNLKLRLYDGDLISKNKQAMIISKQALKSQIDYKIKEQKILYDLALLRIETAKSKIKSAKSALNSAKSAYETIAKKYQAEIVDNVAYLDALSVKTDATSLYQKSLNDLEVAYAIYYFQAGTNLEEFIK